MSFSSSQFWVYSSKYLLENTSLSEPMDKHVYNSDASETAIRSENEIEFTKYVFIDLNLTRTQVKGKIMSETFQVLSEASIQFATLNAL